MDEQPTSELIAEVTTAVRQHLADEDQAAFVDPDVELTAIGFQSLRTVALMVELEQRLGVSFPAEMIRARTFRTVRSIAATIHQLR